MKYFFLVLMLSMSCLTFKSEPADLRQDRQLLLALHKQERQAHLHGDATLLVTEMADHLVNLKDGKVEIFTREQMRQEFANYFGQVRYASWDDSMEPVVNVSPDGKMAWMVIQITARLSDIGGLDAGRPRDFISSWIATYEKQAGAWRMVGISSGLNKKEH